MMVEPTAPMEFLPAQTKKFAWAAALLSLLFIVPLSQFRGGKRRQQRNGTHSVTPAEAT